MVGLAGIWLYCVFVFCFLVCVNGCLGGLLSVF